MKELDIKRMFGIPPKMDYDAHNREAQIVWDSYNADNPVRMPLSLSSGVRILLCNPALNPDGITFEQYSMDVEMMMQVQLAYQYYLRHFLLSDAPMGGERDYAVYVDFQNYYDAAWFGSTIHYPRGNVPCSEPFLTDENKHELFGHRPDVWNTFMQRNTRYGETMAEKCETMTYRGAKVNFAGVSLRGTDGPMTVACSLRGTTEFCIDLYEDTAYALKLLDYITDATIERIVALRGKYGHALPDAFYFADDCIALLSNADYAEYILPRHKRLAAASSSMKEAGFVHLCGDAQRHFQTIRDELNVNFFDTGYPVNLPKLYAELGADVKVRGGVNVSLLLSGSPREIAAETRRIIDQVKPLTKRFIMAEANDLSPGTPPESIAAMYDAVREWGMY